MNPESEEKRSNIRINLPPREKEALVKLFEEDKPRPEYVEGKLKLNFEHRFSDGAVLRVSETADGVAKFELLRDGKPIFDFATLLPKDYTLLSASGVKSRFTEDNEERKYLLGEWAASREGPVISIGDFKNSRDIFGLLHEIGHSHQEVSGAIVKDITEPEPDLTLEETIWKQYIIADSKAERDAWAWALRAARHIKKETGVDLFEIIENSEDLKKMIYLPLLSHKVDDENTLAEALEGEDISPAFLDFIGSELEHLAGLLEKDHPEIMKTRKANRLFEKGKAFRNP